MITISSHLQWNIALKGGGIRQKPLNPLSVASNSAMPWPGCTQHTVWRIKILRCPRGSYRHAASSDHSNHVRLVDHEESRVGVSTSAEHARLRPRLPDGYTWFKLAGEDCLFKRAPGKPSIGIGIYNRQYGKVGKSFEAHP